MKYHLYHQGARLYLKQDGSLLLNAKEESPGTWDKVSAEKLCQPGGQHEHFELELITPQAAQTSLQRIGALLAEIHEEVLFEHDDSSPGPRRILAHGFKGYLNMSPEELVDEMARVQGVLERCLAEDVGGETLVVGYLERIAGYLKLWEEPDAT